MKLSSFVENAIITQGFWPLSFDLIILKCLIIVFKMHKEITNNIFTTSVYKYKGGETTNKFRRKEKNCAWKEKHNTKKMNGT